MKKVNWWIVGIVTVIAILFLFGSGVISGGWRYHGYGMMGNSGMMGSWGNHPFGWFGMGIGMFFMWFIPIGILTLIVFGVASLVRNNTTSTPFASQKSCPHCGKGTQADWQNCPYCGETLK